VFADNFSKVIDWLILLVAQQRQVGLAGGGVAAPE
jgi:hypothetical protein